MGLSMNKVSATDYMPDIAIISRSKTSKLLSGEIMDDHDINLVVRSFSVGQPHRAIPITVAIPIAVAANIEGSVVHANISYAHVDSEGITLGHASGKNYGQGQG